MTHQLAATSCDLPQRFTAAHGDDEKNTDMTTVERFIEKHGELLYKKVLAEFDGNAEYARRAIEVGRPMTARSLAAYMRMCLFDEDQGELDECRHPKLSSCIDYERLAVARWKGGLLHVVAHRGLLYFFETNWWWDGFDD